MGEEAVALARAAGDDFVLAIALNNLGGVAMVLGENEQGTAYIEESLECVAGSAISRGSPSRCATLPKWRCQEGETDKAAAMFAEAAEIATAIGDKRHILFALAGLGQVAYREERWEEAGTHARESLRLAQELAMKLPAADEIFWLAGIAAATGDTARAARLAAAAAFHLCASRTVRGRQSRLPGDHRARESGLRPGNLGAGLGGGQGNDPRRGRRLRTVLRLTAPTTARRRRRTGACRSCSRASGSHRRRPTKPCARCRSTSPGPAG